MEIDHFDQLAPMQQNEINRNHHVQSPSSPTREPPGENSYHHRQSPNETSDKPHHMEIANNRTHSPIDLTVAEHSIPSPPPLPDSPGTEDSAWLRRKTSATTTFTEKAKILLNPYRTAHETLKAQSKSASIMSLLNAQRTPMGVHLTTLSSSRSDTASRGRED